MVTLTSKTTFTVYFDNTNSKDTFIEENVPDENFGGNDSVIVRSYTATGPDNYYGLYYFHVPPAPVENAEIKNMMLHLRSTTIGIPTHIGSLLTMQLSQDFVEGTAVDVADFDDGATWNTYDGINTWTTPGGDVGGVVDNHVITNETNYGYVEVPLDNLLSMNSGAITWNSHLNLILVQQTNAYSTTTDRFDIASKESGTTIPYVVITYTYPKPSKVRGF